MSNVPLTMSLITKLATAVYNVSALYNQMTFEENKKPWGALTNQEQSKHIQWVTDTLNRKTLLPSELHEQWMINMANDGWKFSPLFSKEDKLSPYLQPYDKLSPEIQAKDALVLAILSPFY